MNMLNVPFFFRDQIFYLTFDEIVQIFNSCRSSFNSCRSSCSRVFLGRETCIEAALDTAQLLASKSPAGAQGTKLSMVYSRDHSVAEGLDQKVSTFCHYLSVLVT